jgi:hypothetical protein
MERDLARFHNRSLRHTHTTSRRIRKKPNVVFVLVDNVGWGTFGVYGGTIPTPHIDKLASSCVGDRIHGGRDVLQMDDPEASEVESWAVRVLARAALVESNRSSGGIRRTMGRASRKKAITGSPPAARYRIVLDAYS